MPMVCLLCMACRETEWLISSFTHTSSSEDSFSTFMPSERLPLNLSSSLLRLLLLSRSRDIERRYCLSLPYLSLSPDLKGIDVKEGQLIPLYRFQPEKKSCHNTIGGHEMQEMFQRETLTQNWSQDKCPKPSKTWQMIKYRKSKFAFDYIYNRGVTQRNILCYE